MSLPADHDARMLRARLALDGLTVGNAFGEHFLYPPPGYQTVLELRTLPAGPWEMTDQSEMAMVVGMVLQSGGAIDRDVLAKALASRYRRDVGKGYEMMSHWVLSVISSGLPWEEAAATVNDGTGSKASDAAARAIPIGAYFANELDRVVADARASAEITHAHTEGQAGAIAVAVAAMSAAQMGEKTAERSGGQLLANVLVNTPPGATRDGIEKARALWAAEASVAEAAAELGTGKDRLASDTVPFALYVAARNLRDYPDALWTVVSHHGDTDAVGAIVGGLVALSGGRDSIPIEWMEAREPFSP